MPGDSQHFLVISDIVFDCHVFSMCSNLKPCSLFAAEWNLALTIASLWLVAAQILTSKNHTLLMLFCLPCVSTNKIKFNWKDQTIIIIPYFFLSRIVYFLKVTHLLAKHNSAKEPATTLLNHQVA